MRLAIVSLALSIIGMCLSLYAMSLPTSAAVVCTEAQFKRAMQEARDEQALLAGTGIDPKHLLKEAKARICVVAK